MANKKEKPSELAISDEMKRFYRALNLVQTNAFCRILSGKDAEDIKKRATDEAILLETLLQAPEGERSCPQGKVWDAVEQRCI